MFVYTHKTMYVCVYIYIYMCIQPKRKHVIECISCGITMLRDAKRIGKQHLAIPI